MVIEVVRALDPMAKDKPDDEVLAEARARLGKTGIFDITEYGRAVHAEMEALLSCARVGVSPAGGTLYSTTFPCHNCAKHIVAAGIAKVAYIEPYPKSRAFDLHSDAITSSRTSADDQRVVFEPFVGIGPRRFIDLFSMRLGGGPPAPPRKLKGKVAVWERAKAGQRLPLLVTSYLDREKLLTAELNALLKGDTHDASKKAGQ